MLPRIICKSVGTLHRGQALGEVTRLVMTLVR